MIAFISLLTSFLFLDAAHDQPEPSNVVMIVVDDMKDWVGYLGGYEGKVYTPFIDELASAGVAFTNAHTAAPVCCPSRNAALLGKRPSTTGLYNNNQWWKASDRNATSLPQYFKDNGYYVAGAGKVFHHTPGNNPPCSWNEYKDQEFDDVWNFADWNVEKYTVQYGYRGPIEPYPSWKPLNGMLPIRSELDWGAIPGKPENEYGDVKAVDFARQFLEREHDKPFFLAVGIYKPHLPWHVPQSYYDQYPLDEIVLPEIHNEDLADIPAEGKKIAKSRSEDFFKIRDEGKYKEAVQAYLASISFADKQVGDVYHALMNSKFSDNTIVVLWSDHGWHLGSKHHWHKSTLWEEATRIPFIVKVPGAKRKSNLCHAPVDLTNIFPTLVSLCKLPVKSDLDGKDMSALIMDEKQKWSWPAITISGPGQVAVRTEEWRYIRYSDNSEELYDRKKDPLEWVNVAGEKKHAKILEAHRQLIPTSFASPSPGKSHYFFDPYEYTWLEKETKEFIDGKR